MAEKVHQSPSRRTGGRSALVRAAVLEASIAVLIERGVDAFTIKEVSDRAGVHETTVYRRWGTKDNLALDALLSTVMVENPTPDTGSLREDLLAVVRTLASLMGTTLGDSLIRMGLKRDVPDYEGVRDIFWTDRYSRFATILDRAEARGDLSPGIDRRTTMLTLVGPLYMRLLLTREPLNDGFLQDIVDLLLNGMAPDTTT